MKENTVGSADMGRIKLLRVYFHQKKVQSGKAREPPNGAVPCCQPETVGPGQRSGGSWWAAAS